MEALHVEANDPSLELKRNELGLRYLYKLKSNPSYIHTLNTLDDSEDQKYEESERSVKPIPPKENACSQKSGNVAK